MQKRRFLHFSPQSGKIKTTSFRMIPLLILRVKPPILLLFLKFPLHFSSPLKMMGNRLFVSIVSAFFAFPFSAHNKTPAPYKRRAGILFTSCFHRVSLFDFSAFLCFLFRRQNERKAYRDNKKQLQVLFTAVVFYFFYFFYFFFGTVFMMERMATSVMSTLKRSATMAAKRTSVLSVRPTKIFCRGTKPLPFSPVKIAVERATPKAAPKEEAIL